MKVKDLLSSPERFIRGASARNEKYESVDYDSPEATRWSLNGALLRCYYVSNSYAMDRPLKHAQKEIERVLRVDSYSTGVRLTITDYNLHMPYEELIVMLNKADV